MKRTERVKNFHTAPKGFRQLFGNYYVTCFYRKTPLRFQEGAGITDEICLLLTASSPRVSLRRHRLHDGASVHRRGLPAPPQGPAGDG